MIRGDHERRTTVAELVGPRPAGLVERTFAAAAPNRLWAADPTCIYTRAGFVCAAFVIDTCSQMSVGWRLADHLRPYLALDALAETTIGLYMTELVHRKGPWAGLEKVEIATMEWREWYKQPAPAQRSR